MPLVGNQMSQMQNNESTNQEKKATIYEDKLNNVINATNYAPIQPKATYDPKPILNFNVVSIVKENPQPVNIVPDPSTLNISALYQQSFTDKPSVKVNKDIKKSSSTQDSKKIGVPKSFDFSKFKRIKTETENSIVPKNLSLPEDLNVDKFCVVCGKDFYSIGTLRRHLREVHINVKAKKPVDRAESSVILADLAAHQHTDSSPHLSEEENDSERSSIVPLIEEVFNGGGDFECKHSNCRIKFESESSMLDHMKFHQAIPEKEVCSSSGKILSMLENLNKHVNTYHESQDHEKRPTEKPANVECEAPGCGKRFRSRSSMLRHYDTHKLVRERDFICQVCNSGFYNKDYLRKHIRNIHKDTNLTENI